MLAQHEQAVICFKTEVLDGDPDVRFCPVRCEEFQESCLDAHLMVHNDDERRACLGYIISSKLSKSSTRGSTTPGENPGTQRTTTPYCSVCGQSFRRKIDLIVHMRSHPKFPRKAEPKIGGWLPTRQLQMNLKPHIDQELKIEHQELPKRKKSTGVNSFLKQEPDFASKEVVCTICSNWTGSEKSLSTHERKCQVKKSLYKYLRTEGGCRTWQKVAMKPIHVPWGMKIAKIVQGRKSIHRSNGEDDATVSRSPPSLQFDLSRA